MTDKEYETARNKLIREATRRANLEYGKLAPKTGVLEYRKNWTVKFLGEMDKMARLEGLVE